MDPEKYLQDCVKLDPLALEEEFSRLPGDLAYWNAQYGDVIQTYLTAELHRKQVKARIHLELRAGAGAGSKLTVGDLDAAVEIHPDVVLAGEAEILAEARKVRTYGIVDAIRTKRDMLISLGAQIRAEMQTDPSLRDLSRQAKQFTNR